MSVNGSTRPLSGSRRSTVSSPRRGSRATLLNGSKAVLALALVLAAATACSKSSDDGSHEAKDWKVGDCAGPDSSKKDAYQPLDCDDSKATLKALEIKDGAIFSDSIQCPAGDGRDHLGEGLLRFGRRQYRHPQQDHLRPQPERRPPR